MEHVENIKLFVNGLEDYLEMVRAEGEISCIDYNIIMGFLENIKEEICFLNCETGVS